MAKATCSTPLRNMPFKALDDAFDHFAEVVVCHNLRNLIDYLLELRIVRHRVSEAISQKLLDNRATKQLIVGTGFCRSASNGFNASAMQFDVTP